MGLPIHTITPQKLAGLLFILAAAPLMAALISQYGFGYPPCELCMYQRYPYLIVCALAPLIIAKPNWCRPIVALCCLSFLGTALIGIFHTGVEQEWWEYASACSSLTTGDGSLEGLRSAILEAPLVSCKQTTFAFFGLSMASWNALTGIVLAGFFAALGRKRKTI